MVSMWQELPPHTRDWSEEDWEQYFFEQDRLWYEFGADDSSEPSSELDPEAPYLPFLDDPFDMDASIELHDLGDLLSECDEVFDDDDDDGDDVPFSGGKKIIDDDMPVYRAAIDFNQCICDLYEPEGLLRNTGPREYILNTLLSESFLIQDYIISGHQYGYSEDTLCGNIVLCRRALNSLDRCIQCLERLDSTDDTKRCTLVIRARVVRAFLLRRIEDLRGMIWWR